MSFARLWAVFRKEITDHLRDRRALFSMAFGIFVGPILIGVLLTQVAEDRARSESVDIPMAGQEHAPELVRWLNAQAGVTVSEAPEESETEIRDGSRNLAVIVSPEFNERFAKGRPAKVKLIFDGSDRKVGGQVSRIQRLLENYSSGIASLRLVARGVNPSLAAPLQVRRVEVSTAQRRAAKVLNFWPMLILLAGFVAGMGAAADATAGERERGSLEALLLNPTPIPWIVLGKWMATAALAVGGAWLSLSLCVAVLGQIPLHELGLRFRLESSQMLWAAALVVPPSLLAASMQMLLCSFSKTLKEAQSYLGLLILFPMAPGFAIEMFNLETGLTTAAVPFLGQTQLLQDLFAGEPMNQIEFGAAALGTLAAAAACVFLMTRLYRSERILFSR